MRYLLQRTDTGEFFCHPQGPRFKQWTDSEANALEWANIDRATAAVRTSVELWKIPAQIYSGDSSIVS